MFKRRDFLIIFIFILTCVYVLFSLFKIITTIAPDFPSYYYATKDLVNHKNPYIDKAIPNIFIYPTPSSLFYLPFILIPYIQAQAIFIILSALSVPAIIYLSLRLVYKKFSWRHLLILTMAAFIFFPTKFTLGMGQVNLLALLMLMMGYLYYSQDKKVICGVITGLAIIMKPFLCFIILFYIFRKEWKLLIYIIITIIVLYSVSFSLYGFSSDIYYFQSIVPGLINGVEGREVYYNQGIMGLISRMTDEIFLRKYLPILISGSMVVFLFYLLIKRKPDINIQYAIFLTIIPIIHTLSWQHYYVILFFPFTVAVKEILFNKKYHLFYLLIFAYLLIGFNIEYPVIFSSFPFSIILSHVLYGNLILLFILFHLTKVNIKGNK